MGGHNGEYRGGQWGGGTVVNPEGVSGGEVQW